MADAKPLRIFELEVSDLKRIEFVHITPKDSIVEIAGRNGSGKTSTLDSILWALSGKDAITAEPVRAGAEKATITLDLGEIIVKRTIKPDRSGTISISNKEGMTAKSPQQLLDKLVGDLSLDPLALMRKSPAEQLDMLRGFAPDTDFKALDRSEEAAVTARRDANRDLKQAEAVVASHPMDDAAIPEGVDVSALTEQLQEAQRHNELVRRTENDRAGFGRTADDCRDRAATLMERHARLLEEAARLSAEANALREQEDKARAKALEPIEIKPIDESQFTSQLKEAQAKNDERARALALAERMKAERDELAKHKAAADKADKAVAEIRAKRSDALRAINLPIDGLLITPEGITLNGHPLDQASDAEQLRVGIALAMKANPRLRVVRIRDGSLLDDDSMAMLRDMADREGFQVWIERVGAGGANAIVIEAGRVKGAVEEAKAAE